MSTIAEIEAVVDALPSPQQEELFRHLTERLRERQKPKRALPLVPSTGRYGGFKKGWAASKAKAIWSGVVW